MKLNRCSKAVAVLALTCGVSGCANKTQTGALVGGAGGAAVGAGIGSLAKNSNAGVGALIGGAVGAIGGAMIGNSMDRADQRQADARRVSHRAYEGSVTQADVIDWTGRGTRDDIIIDRIERSGTVFHLTARDENQLRDAGVSEDVIRAMKATARP